MHIQLIEVKDFGTIEHVEVELENGLNVISGPNEAGKSTLMRAAWLCLMWPHRSQSEEIRSITPNRGGTPEVRVVLEDEGATYEMQKTFNGSGGSAHLRVQQADGHVVDETDDEAEEKLRDVIGVGELGGRPKSPAHYGFWPAVWTRQDERHLDPGKHLTKKGSRESLSGILAEIGGDVLAGSGADVVEQAKEEYDRFYTKTGKPTSSKNAPLVQAQERLNDAEEQFGQLQEMRQNYEDDLDQLERLEQQIEEIDEELPELESNAKEAAEKYNQVQTLRNELDQEKARLETRKTKVQQAQERVDRRDSLRNDMQELESDIDGLAKKMEEAESRIEQHTETLGELEDQKREAEEERDRLKRKERLLQAHLDVLTAKERQQEIADRSDRYQQLTDERQELRRRQERLFVDDEDVSRLEELKREREETKTRLEAAAARVSVEGSTDLDVQVGDTTVTLPDDEGEQYLLDSRTTVRVGSELRIHVEPGGKNLADIRSDAETAEEEYQDALDDLGVESVPDARSQVQEKEQIDTRLEDIDRQIDRLLPEDSDDFADAEARAEARVENAQDSRSDLAEDGEVEALPTEEEAVRDRLQQTSDELETAQDALAEARGDLQDHEETLQSLRGDLRELQTQKDGKEESLESAQEDLDRHVNEHGTDEEIQDALDEVRRKRDEKKEEVDDIRDELADLDVESIEARKKRTEQALANTQSDRNELKETLNKVEGRLERNELHGLHERLQKARQKLEDAQADVDRLQKQADAAKLLYDTLTEKRAEARKRYLAPLREEVEGLLGRFFDAEESTVAFDEDLALEKLSRSTDGSFDFDQLSAGARQQLSLLIRLAMARLVARERPHPVFFDDALSDTDPDRFEVIGDILHSVSQDMQIILTTCHRSRHRRLGAHNLRMEALKKGG
jgi:DNA repair exonuclease SbcCD ATPase subunit